MIAFYLASSYIHNDFLMFVCLYLNGLVCDLFNTLKLVVNIDQSHNKQFHKLKLKFNDLFLMHPVSITLEGSDEIAEGKLELHYMDKNQSVYVFTEKIT